MKDQSAFLQNPCAFPDSIWSWTKAPSSGAILLSPSPKLHSVETWGATGGGVRGEVRRWGVAKKSEQYYRGVKASFTIDLPDLKFLIDFFLSHVWKNIKLASCYTGIPSLFNFERKDGNVTKKKDRILIKDLINYKLKYWTKEARLILHSGIYIFCYQYFGRHGLPSSGLGSYIQWYGLS